MCPTPISKIEGVVKEYAGPFAQFVVKKQMKALGIEEDKDYPQEKLVGFINNIIKDSIYDPKLQKEARKRLMKIIKTNGHSTEPDFKILVSK